MPESSKKSNHKVILYGIISPDYTFNLIHEVAKNESKNRFITQERVFSLIKSYFNSINNYNPNNIQNLMSDIDIACTMYGILTHNKSIYRMLHNNSININGKNCYPRKNIIIVTKPNQNNIKSFIKKRINLKKISKKVPYSDSYFTLISNNKTKSIHTLTLKDIHLNLNHLLNQINSKSKNKSISSNNLSFKNKDQFFRNSKTKYNPKEVHNDAIKYINLLKKKYNKRYILKIIHSNLNNLIKNIDKIRDIQRIMFNANIFTTACNILLKNNSFHLINKDINGNKIHNINMKIILKPNHIVKLSKIFSSKEINNVIKNIPIEDSYFIIKNNKICPLNKEDIKYILIHIKNDISKKLI